MINKFIAIGYHGALQSDIDKILSEIKFDLNKGDRFLGQGFYLWRDSYLRAKVWRGVGEKRSNTEERSVIRVQIEDNIKNTFNFTSYKWNNELKILNMYSELDSNLSFGEFLDFLIYEQKLEINLIIISDLTAAPKIINVDNNIQFAYSDTQMCAKNLNCITKVEKIK
ncbi:hypothetical protein L5F41_05950 [Aliarcobacter butzleri]|uniref:hypothetical protein n=1 Tax=Aliarcobacter butzleri TaxID=28197 RepID=UPI001EDA2273|nr:hypothetical protein [Aliarcobacter butzleri]MCG3701634.1 hypothetical protein [Aliarcobacter butzleri]